MIEKKLEKIDRKIDKLRKKIKGLEDLKVESEVFDRSTLLTLYYLSNKGLIDVMYGVIKAGKESNVFLAKTREGRDVAVKIHMVTTSDFRKMDSYLIGDKRFHGYRRNRRGIVFTWVRKEFKNLETARKAGVRVPEPLGFKNNVIVMEFIGENGIAAPMLKNVELEDPEHIFAEVVENYRKLYCRAGLVHADMSEYNILLHGDEPWFIDLSQAVPLDHPYAREFLARDIANIARFFKKYLDVAEDQIYKEVTSC